MSLFPSYRHRMYAGAILRKQKTEKNQFKLTFINDIDIVDILNETIHMFFQQSNKRAVKCRISLLCTLRCEQTLIDKIVSENRSQSYK